jgi:hypothetical protein
MEADAKAKPLAGWTSAELSGAANRRAATTTTQMAGQGWSSICVSVLVSVLRRELCFGPVFPIAIARDVDRAPTTCPAALSINIAAASLFCTFLPPHPHPQPPPASSDSLSRPPVDRIQHLHRTSINRSFFSHPHTTTTATMKYSAALISAAATIVAAQSMSDLPQCGVSQSLDQQSMSLVARATIGATENATHTIINAQQ